MFMVHFRVEKQSLVRGTGCTGCSLVRLTGKVCDYKSAPAPLNIDAEYWDRLMLDMLLGLRPWTATLAPLSAPMPLVTILLGT